MEHVRGATHLVYLYSCMWGSGKTRGGGKEYNGPCSRVSALRTSPDDAAFGIGVSRRGRAVGHAWRAADAQTKRGKSKAKARPPQTQNQI